MDNAKLSLLKNNIEIKSMYFSVAHSILSTNIKNELISSKVIESQSSKVTNDMLLKVKKLSLKDELKNDIECTIGLKYLTELEEIDISNNDLSDVSWLSSCTKLKKVDISNNRIKNFNQIVDNQDLQYLDASNNEINDISKIEFMQKINYLDLSNNEITDISDVSTSYGLESLFLNNNNLTVFKDRLSGLENLNELGVGNCNIPFSDIISLKYLNKLSYLDISGTNPTITQISNLGNLKTLVLKNCRLNTKNLSSLNNLNNLEILDISNNNLDSESYNNALDGTKISNLNSLFIGGNAKACYDLKKFASSDGENVSDRSRIVCAVLAFFLGGIGIHRFYMGKNTSGVLMLLFCWTGIPLIIALIDFIIILCGNAKDAEGKEIRYW